MAWARSKTPMPRRNNWWCARGGGGEVCGAVQSRSFLSGAGRNKPIEAANRIAQTIPPAARERSRLFSPELLRTVARHGRRKFSQRAWFDREYAFPDRERLHLCCAAAPD